MAHKIAVMNHKGGVGKTVLAVNLAATFAARTSPPNRVLMIDLDTQGNASAYLYLSKGERSEDLENRDLGQVLRHGKGLDEVLFPYQYPTELKKPGNGASNVVEQKDVDEKTGEEVTRYYTWTDVPNFHVVPAYEDLGLSLDIDDFLSNLELDTLKKAVEKIEDQYDYIIFDCPPTFNKLSRMALVAADKVIVPVKPGEFEIKGLLAMYSQLKKLEEETGHKIVYFKVIMNLLRASSKKHIDYLARIQERLEDHLALTAIPLAEEITQSIKTPLPLAFSKKGDLKKAFMDIAREIDQDLKKPSTQEVSLG